MSDYGFLTYDESGKKLQGSVNSKWPIFGPKYSDIKNSFKTVHFTDLTQYDFRTSPSVTLPSIGGGNGEQYKISEYHGYEKVLVATIPHGQKKRPVGYAVFTGSFVKNTRGKWSYTNYYDRHGIFPPSTGSKPLYGNGQTTGNMQSTAGDIIRATNSSGTMSAFSVNPFSECNISYPSNQYQLFAWLGSAWENSFSIPGNNSSTDDHIPYDRQPYAVEIDNDNVYIYRYYYWCDVYKRTFYRNEYGYDQSDLRARMQGIIDYAGSSFDVTIYLCPYSMEDFI